MNGYDLGSEACVRAFEYDGLHSGASAISAGPTAPPTIIPPFRGGRHWVWGPRGSVDRDGVPTSKFASPHGFRRVNFQLPNALELRASLKSRPKGKVHDGRVLGLA